MQSNKNDSITESKKEEILLEVWKRVLRAERVGVNDNFFELGGDFYKAVQISARLKEFRLKLDVDDLLQNPQISRLLTFVRPLEGIESPSGEDSGCKVPVPFQYAGISEETLDELKKYIEGMAGEGVEIEDIYPLTPVQERMFMHSFFFKQSRANYLQYAFILSGHLNVEMFEKSFNVVIQRHEIFRTVFTSRRLKKPLQVVLKERRTKVGYEDISGLGPEDREAYTRKVKKADEERGFNITKDILTRMTILKTGEQAYEVIWSFHHILLDGWSIEIVCNEIFRAYKALNAHEDVNLGTVHPAVRYIAWLEDQNRQETVAFWKNYLQDYQQQAALRKFGSAVNEGEYKREEMIFSLGLELSEGLRKIARDNRVIIDIVFQTIWGVILQAYHGVNDVAFLTVVSGRPSEVDGIDRMVGFFVNMNPVRVRCGDSAAFSGLVRQVHRESVEAKRHEYCPIKEITENTQASIDLTDNVVIFESYPLDEDVMNLTRNGFYEFIIERKEVYQQTGFDFNFVIIPGSDYKIALNFNGLIYGPDFIRNLKNDICTIAARIVKDPDILIEALRDGTSGNKSETDKYILEG